MPSAPSAGLAGTPATSTDSIDAPGGSDTFMNGCARLRSQSETSVSARPFARHERRRDRALGDGGQDGRIGEARDVERERGTPVAAR